MLNPFGFTSQRSTAADCCILRIPELLDHNAAGGADAFADQFRIIAVGKGGINAFPP